MHHLSSLSNNISDHLTYFGVDMGCDTSSKCKIVMAPSLASYGIGRPTSYRCSDRIHSCIYLKFVTQASAHTLGEYVLLHHVMGETDGDSWNLVVTESDQASRQVSKQASGSTNAPHDLVFPATGPSLGTTQPTATITSTEDLRRVAFTTPQTALGKNKHRAATPTHSKSRARGKRKQKRRSSRTYRGRLNFGPEDEVSPPRHRKERRREDNRRPPVFGRIGKQVSGTQTANLQNFSDHENNDWRISVHDRLGNRDVHSRLGQRRSSSESPPSSDSEDSRRKRRRRVSVSSEDTSDNEDAETGHWKSKNRYREDEDMSLPASPKGDPDDHLKIFESAATIENWPQPVAIGGSPKRLHERYKDECLHDKACPEILKISGFMNGINNPELIKRLNDRVPQTFDELMKRTRSFIQGEAAAADSRKGYSNNRSQEHSRRQSNDQSSSRNNSYRSQRGGRGNDKYTPLTMTPKEILATEGSNFPKPPPMRTPESNRAGNGYCEFL
ncbi:hypothetical protein Tco_0351147 [Tanacetum coccineum]